MAVIGVADILVRPTFRGLQGEVGRQIDGTSQSAGVKKAGTKIGKGLVTAAKVGLAGGAALLGASLAKGFGRLTAIENAQAKLTGLGHSAKTVESIMTNASAAVKGTAFGLDEAATVSATAVAAGIKPGKELERTLKLTADAATIAGVGMSDMGSIFNKVASSNKIQGDTIAQLNDAGIPVVQLLSKELGKSAAEVTALASKGKIDFATFQNAMEKGMGGAALESGKTLQGAVKNSWASLGRFGANLMSGVYPLVTKFFQGFIKFMGPMEDAAKKIGAAVGTFLTDKIAKAVKVIGPQLEKLTSGFKKVFATIGPAVGDAVRDAKTGMGAMVKAFQSGSDQATQTGLAGFIENIGIVARDVFDAFAPAISAVVDAFKPLGGQLMDIMSGLSPMSMIMKALQPIIPMLAQAFQVVGTSIAQIIPAVAQISASIQSALIPIITQVIQTVLPPLISLFQRIVPVITNVLTSLAPLIDTILNVLTPVIEALLPVVETVFNAIAPIIEAALTVVQGVIQTVTALIKGDWSGVWNGIKKTFSGIWDGIKAVVTGAINIIKSYLSAWLQIVSGIWSKAWGGISAFFSGIWNGIKRFVGGAVDAVKKTITDFLEAIGTAWNKAWGAIGDFLSGAWEGITKSVSDGIKGVTDFFGGLWGKVEDAIGDISGNMLKVGEHMIQGFIDGIAGMAGKIKEKVEGVIGGAIGWAKDILGIHSPSRVFRSIGNFLGIGFVEGINGTQKQVKSATSKLVDMTIDAFEKREEVVKKANARIEKINAQLKALPEANQKAAKRVDKAQDKVKEARAKLTAAKKAAASKLTQKEADAILKVQRAQEKVNEATAKANKKGQTKAQQAASAKALKTAQRQLSDAKKAAGRSVSSSKQSTQAAVESAKKALASAKASLADAKAAQKATAAKSAAKAKDLKAQKAEAKGQKAAYSALNPKAKTALVKKLEAEQKALDGLAKKRDAVTAKLKTAQKNLEDLTKARSDYEGNIIDRLTGSGDVTDMGDSADAIIANLAKVKAGIDAFKKNVEALKKAGLNQDAIDQIVQAGPEAGNKTAEALLAGGADVIKQVNTLQGQIGASAKSMASVAGDAMYGAGIAAAQQTVAGLKSQEAIISAAMTEIANDMNKSVAKAMGIKPSAELAKQQKTAGQQSVAGIMAGVKAKTPELMKQMAKLAKDMAKKVKTALKIHSPSRLFADEVGEMIPAGIGEGVEAGADDLNAKVANLVQVPDVPAVTAAGGLDGTAVPDAGLTQFGDTAVDVFADSTSALAGFLASAKAGVRGALVPVLTAARTATTGLGTTSAQMWAKTAAKLTSSYRTGMKPSLDQLNTTLSKTLPASSRSARDGSTAAWSGLSSSMGSTWTKGIKPTLDKASSALKNALPGAFRSGRTSSSDAFSGLKSDVTSTWTKGIRPQLDALGDFVTDTLPDSFESGVKAMRKAWDGLREATRKPVSFIIAEVYNKGLRGVWNKVASQFGEKALPEFKPKGFYDGGKVTGPGTGRSDSIPARLSNGEFVVNATATRKWLPLLHKINGPRGAGYGQAYKDGGLVYPVAGGRPTSRFGVARSGYSHAGFDLAVPVGTAVRAALAGVVTKAGWNAVPGRTGIGMLLQHENGMATYYGHLSRTLAKVGDQVAQGAQIALSGNTGRSTGPHLHFETWVGGKPVDPERLFKGAPLPVGGSGLSPEETLESLSAPFKELTKGLGAMPSAGQFSELLATGSQRMLEAPLAWMKANLDKLISGDVDGGDGITQGKGSIKEQVRAVAKSFGWGDGEQWAALDWLVSHESSWNPNARNPKSSAAGLFQKMQLLNGPVESTPAGQAQWGLKYIKGRYGNPVNAKSFWQKHHWYRDGGAVRPELHDQGGWLKPGLTSVLNATRRPEAILNPSQWRAAEAAINLAVQGQGFPDTLTLSVDGQQFTAYVSGVTDARLAHHADGLRQVSRQYAGARR
ncbi:MAG: peptidoglycan DD-metalloendopeptidase family protein [Arthrobacter sp.]|jgi:tape measure domain-containing protein|nr:peptidoglycan DD-metalloendopeptidase family protein [Arthrobacter sp.]